MTFDTFDESEILQAVVWAAKLKYKTNPKLYAQQLTGVVDAESKIPEYYEGYKQKVKDFRQIGIHARPGVFPYELFANRSPNQDEKEARYIKDNYQQKTLNVFVDFINTIGRMFSDNNWSVEYGQDDDVFKNLNASYQEYVENNIDYFGSLEAYVKEIVLPSKIRDAEGVIAVRPREIRYVSNNGEMVIDNGRLIEPQPYYYTCENVIGEKSGKWCLIECNDKSLINYGATKSESGLVYWLYNRNNIWRIYQTGRASDFKFVVELFWNHNLDEVFVYKLKGIPVHKDNHIMWQSPFLYCCSYLNSAILDEGNIMASKAKCVYPHVVQLGNLCQFRYTDSNSNISQCNDGQVFDTSKNDYIDCPSCKGVGIKSRLSPLGTLLLKPKDSINDGDMSFSGDPLKFVSPETTTLEFLRAEINNAFYEARKIMHLTTSTTDVQGSVDMTATGQYMDMKSMYAFIRPISDQTFNIYESISNAIGVQRYGESFKPPVFSYPNTFDFQTDADYIQQIKNLTDASAPPFMIQAVMLKYLRALFYSDTVTSQAYELIINSDRLIGVSADDIAFGLSKGTILPWEVILHDSAFSFVNTLFMDYNNANAGSSFFDQDFDIQKAALIDMAKAKALEAKPVNNEQQLVSNILNAAVTP